LRAAITPGEGVLIMEVTFSTTAVFNGILYLLAIGVGVLLILVLIRMLQIQKKIDKVVSDNSGHINKLMIALPVAMDSFNDGVRSIKQTVDTATSAMVPVVGISMPVADGFLSGAEGIINIAQGIGDAIKATIKYFKK
jgi:hypothetical protein